MKTFREEIELRFSDEISIEIRPGISEVLVWNKGTGYGNYSMFDALEKVHELIGHTQVKEISTLRFATH